MYVHKNCTCVEIVYKNAVLKTAKLQNRSKKNAVLKPQIFVRFENRKKVVRF